MGRSPVLSNMPVRPHIGSENAVEIHVLALSAKRCWFLKSEPSQMDSVSRVQKPLTLLAQHAILLAPRAVWPILRRLFRSNEHR